MEHGPRTLMVSLLIAVSGCSLSLSGPDGDRPVHVAPECDTGKGMVAVDGVIGGLFAAGALSALSEEAPEAAAITALVSVAFIASAARGNGVVNRCREAFAAYGMRPPLEQRPAGFAGPSRTFEDPYAPPSDLPARRVAPPSAPPLAVTPPNATPTVPVAPAAASRPAPRPAPAPAPAPGDEWADFWTEVP